MPDIVTIDQVVTKNDYLTQEETIINGTYVAQVLAGWGWTLNAISATLANMEAESGINAGICEGLVFGANKGFGLTQWTPPTKYTGWARQNGYSTARVTDYVAYSNMDWELDYFKAEYNGSPQQWIKTSTYPMTFEEFAMSTVDPETLAYVFMHNYERPADTNQPDRQIKARWWFDYLSDGGGTPDTPTPSGKRRRMSRVCFLWEGSRRYV